MSSELSNALNPAIVSRPRRRHAPPATQPTAPTAPVLAPQHIAPHRSELELAIAPPPLSTEPEAQAVIAQVDVQGSSRNASPMVELYRVVATARQAAAIEQQRRIIWEQEQEAKSSQRQKELERQVFEMREELAMLKTYISMHPNIPTPPVLQEQVAIANTIPTSAYIEPASPATGPPPKTPLSPISPAPRHPEAQEPMFIQGSSVRPLNSSNAYADDSSEAGATSSLSVLSPPSSTVPSPQISSTGIAPTPLPVHTQPMEALAPPTPQSTGSSVTPVPSTLSPKAVPRKRPRHVVEDDSDTESYSEDESDGPNSDMPRERKNGHDNRCLTIHHAMRIHIRKMMKLKHGEDLPESHFEGAPFLTDQPVRFVWNKTAKQSAHNAAMKRRVVNDIKAHRTRYKHVPDKDFNKKNLDSAFDQVFTTLRQKFKAQKDTTAATRLQRRENHKALRARRLQRKKTKLGNRTDARRQIDAFAQPVFEVALQPECMSSEESDGEFVENDEKVLVFRTRGPSWRSARLLRYYAVLDEQDRHEKSLKPKRGIGRRVRREGPPKDGFSLPPKGVARWMVSQKWLRETEEMRPDLAVALRDAIVDEVEQESELTQALLGGEDSEDESNRGPPAAEVHAHVSDTSYSLQNALQPI
ncbi:hypothetical protein C8Q78DRAFT_68348 [Trametes maxima]|nr:hypothetical protein C8Q78DRAFT_68348 [Trametes maxima]